MIGFLKSLISRIFSTSKKIESNTMDVKNIPSGILLMTIKADLVKTLSQSQKFRKVKEDEQYDPMQGRSVPEWEIYERMQMRNRSNKWRKALGYDNLSEQNIYQAEIRAVGRVDYTSKYALYCAKLVINEPW